MARKAAPQAPPPASRALPALLPFVQLDSELGIEPIAAERWIGRRAHARPVLRSVGPRTAERALQHRRSPRVDRRHGIGSAVRSAHSRDHFALLHVALAEAPEKPLLTGDQSPARAIARHTAVTVDLVS